MINQKLFRTILSFSLISIFLLYSISVLPIPFFQQLENLAYDAKLNLSLPNTIDKRIVIVDIDEKSLKEIGHFPWSRDVVSTMVSNLFNKYNAKVVGFDIVFAEKEESSANKILNRLAKGSLKNNKGYIKEFHKLKYSLDNDKKLARSIEHKPIVLGYYFKSTADQKKSISTGMLPAPILDLGTSWNDEIAFQKPEGYGANIKLLQGAAKLGGYFDNPLVDSDGIFRRVPIVQQYDNKLYESLALAVAREALGGQGIELKFVVAGIGENGEELYAIEAVSFGNTLIPVDKQASVLVPYLGKQGSFMYIPAADIIKRRADPNILNNAIVLIGTTAPGLLDLRSTPVQHVYPGVEVHANIVSGILSGTIKQKPDYSIGYEFSLLTILGLLLAFLIPRLSPLMTSVLTLVLIGLVITLDFFLWSYYATVLPIASLLLLITFMFILHMSYGFFVETRGKRELARVFGQYIPPELVDDLGEDPNAMNLEGKSREMSVLFSDVRGFTTISEGLDSKELTQLMNAFLTPMTHVIHNNRGTIDKYMGDAIMCFWGAPLEDHQHAAHSIKAALEMIAELKRLQPIFKENGWPEIKVGVGINTGTMSVGNMGSEFRMAYTVMGDAVNLGSRLEGLTKAYGVQIIVSESTKNAVPEYEYRKLDVVRVKGKTKPVAIFEPIGSSETIYTQEKKRIYRYHRAVKLYREMKWEAAEKEFYLLSQQEPKRYIHKLYLDRIMFFKNNSPGKDWDGVFTFTTK